MLKKKMKLKESFHLFLKNKKKSEINNSANPMKMKIAVFIIKL